MKFTDYYKLTKPTTKYCLNISGIIFTSIAAIIWAITEVNGNSGSIIDVAKVFIICFLFGNAFGLFIVILAITEGFIQVKGTIHMYNSIPVEIREQYELMLFAQPLNPKHNYLKMQINSTKPHAPHLIFNKLTNPNRMQIIAVIKLENNDYQTLKLKIDKKYGWEQINLTGWGLSSTINWKSSKKIISSEIERNIEKLINVSQQEGLKMEVLPMPEIDY